MRRPLSVRLREIRDRMNLLGDDEDVATLDEAVKVAEEAERQAAEDAQLDLDVRVDPDTPEEPVRVDPDTKTLGPYARDSETSRQAALAAYPRQGTDRRRILECLYATADEWRRRNDRPSGLTRDQLATALAMSPNTVRPRVVELMEGRWIKDSGRRRPTAQGLDAEVLVLTDEAVVAIERGAAALDAV